MQSDPRAMRIAPSSLSISWQRRANVAEIDESSGGERKLPFAKERAASPSGNVSAGRIAVHAGTNAAQHAPRVCSLGRLRLQQSVHTVDQTAGAERLRDVIIRARFVALLLIDVAA